jgi:hypothetical protein|tara:strand:- start:1512 stop:2438 length:927 start_codon:yes stop_codon:yes gene_type:complete
MAYITQYKYYENDGNVREDANWGSYQYVSLYDVVNNFLLMYSGNHSLVNNEERYKIMFHAKRAVQELNYDAFKEIKVLELNVTDQYRFVLPSDYVNWVRVSVYKNGYLHPLTENIQVNYASAYLQDNTGRILFDIDGNALSPEFSDIDYDRIRGSQRTMYLNDGHPFNGYEGYCCGGAWYFDAPFGEGWFSLNTETANANPTFAIDKTMGVINFSSSIGDNRVILEYVSDGMENGDDSKVHVNKMFEDYVYAYIEYAILNSKLGVQEYVVRRALKKKGALLRNAKIRISNIHPGRLLMNMRGKDKWIK